MNCKKGTAAIIQQIICLLDNIEDYKYCKPLTIFDGAFLGKHFRHIFDFYACLINGVHAGLVNYSNRARNPEIEISTNTASKAFEEIIKQMENMNENMRIKVKADFGETDRENRVWVLSSVGRELMYAYDHAVHHLAMIKIALKSSFPEVHCEESLGVAPATLRYEQEKTIVKV